MWAVNFCQPKCFLITIYFIILCTGFVKAGIKVPVIAGIMPVTNSKQIKRICGISGTLLPQRFRRIVDRYGNNTLAMKQAGIAFATEQIIDLYANGINAVHVYSMNNPEVAKQIQKNISEIIK